MERRIGAKILILTLVLSIPTLMVMSIRLGLQAMSLSNWLLFVFSLFLLLLLAAMGLLTVLGVRALRKTDAMEKLYQQSWSVVIMSFLLCFYIAADFIVQRRLFYEDAIATAVVFLFGALGIISGVVMVYESKKGTEQVSHEEYS